MFTLQNGEFGFTHRAEPPRTRIVQRIGATLMGTPVYYTHDGMTLTLADWAKRTGINKRSLRSRIKMGWPMERVISRRIHKGTDPEEFKDSRVIQIRAEEIFRRWARLPPPQP